MQKLLLMAYLAYAFTTCDVRYNNICDAAFDHCSAKCHVQQNGKCANVLSLVKQFERHFSLR